VELLSGCKAIDPFGHETLRERMPDEKSSLWHNPEKEMTQVVYQRAGDRTLCSLLRALRIAT
jgi:hypothetical protein